MTAEHTSTTIRLDMPLLINGSGTPVKNRKLSQSSLEVLAIIAYKQPITKLEIEEEKKKLEMEKQMIIRL